MQASVRCETRKEVKTVQWSRPCLLYTSDAADEEDSVDLGGRRIIKKKIKKGERDICKKGVRFVLWNLIVTV